MSSLAAFKTNDVKSMSETDIALRESIEDEINKSNKLIEAKYDLSLLEHKLILFAMTKIDPDTNSNIAEMTVEEYCEATGTTGKRYSEIREKIINLRKKDIIITSYDGNREIKEEYIGGWIISSKYRSGKIQLAFDYNLLPHLKKLPDSTSYRFRSIAKISTKYAIRVYEIMKEYEYRSTIEIPYPIFKNIVCEPGTNERPYDFITRVLKPAQKDIRINTDIAFSFKEIRKGKKLEALKFFIHKNVPMDDSRFKDDYEKKIYEESLKREKARFEYFNESDPKKVYEKYKGTPKNELIIEFCKVFQYRYDAKFKEDILYRHEVSDILTVFFNIADDAYDIKKSPVGYVTAIFKNLKNKD